MLARSVHVHLYRATVFHTPPFSTTGCQDDFPIINWHPSLISREKGFPSPIH